jgi:excisionase family DNA binding protein
VDRITPADAANRLGMSPREIYQLIDERRLAAFRHGRTIRLDRDEVERFADGLDGGEAHDRASRRPMTPRGSGSVSLAIEIPPDESATQQSH